MGRNRTEIRKMAEDGQQWRNADAALCATLHDEQYVSERGFGAHYGQHEK